MGKTLFPSRSDMARAARKVMTPFYFYDADIIRARYEALGKALPDRWHIFYAAKANPNVEILKIYRASGARPECASAGEMLACFRAGYSASELVLSGPVKTERELKLVKQSPPHMVHAETEGELAALDALGKKVNVALRLNIDAGMPHSADGRIMSGGMDKFGFSRSDAEEVLRRKERFRNLSIEGFHFYLGTNIATPRQWLRGARTFATAAAELSRRHRLQPSYLNFGGGLGIPYGHRGREFSLTEFKRGLALLHRHLASVPSFQHAAFHVEPGRYLMGPCGAYVVKVLGLKKMRGMNFALTDGGIHHALFPFRVSREFPSSLVKGKGGPEEHYVLGGPLCTSLDQSDLPLRLPKLRTGDLVAIHNSGAYGYGTGMHFFLSHPLPSEMLKEGRSLYLIRKLSTSAHLFRYQRRDRI